MSRHPRSTLEAVLAERILILDGAMGSLIQGLGTPDAELRGERFKNHPSDLRNNCDLRCLTLPQAVTVFHAEYFAAGADMVETNTFNATSIAQADFGLSHLVEELNTAAVACARKAADEAEAKSPGRTCFVAGALGPLNRTLSLSPDVQRPDFRAVTWAQVVEAYREQVRALLVGGVDTLLVETIFDTLNAKAALYAIEECFDDLGIRVPVMVSATITDASGRTLSGQTVGAFYASIRHASPFSVGLNCALGGAQMRPFIQELARIAECPVSCYPNAGLPNAMGGYDETPADMAGILGEFAKDGLVNIVGGCCGSTPAHIRAIADAVRRARPRKVPQPSTAFSLSGLEPLVVQS